MTVLWENDHCFWNERKIGLRIGRKKKKKSGCNSERVYLFGDANNTKIVFDFFTMPTVTK